MLFPCLALIAVLYPSIVPQVSAEGEPCTRNNLQGVCINIRSCPFLINILQTQGIAASEYLMSTVCYYADRDPIVCCPQNDSRDSKEIRDSPYGPLQPPDCGFSSIQHQRVVGGVPAEPGAWPWLAALGYENKNNPSQPKWLCGGSLISARHVLTAAHCIRNDLYTVRIGDLDLYSDNDGVQPVQLGIDKVTVHPQYSTSSTVNDIAIIRLNNDVQFSEHVRPICLPVGPSLRNNNFVRAYPFIAGWGSLAPKGASSAVLMEAQVPVVTNAACKDAYSRFQAAVIDDRVLCAGYARGGKDACQGDSGGPLMLPQRQHFFQIGVVSYGYKCALPGYPGVYTRVTDFLDFIISAMHVLLYLVNPATAKMLFPCLALIAVLYPSMVPQVSAEGEPCTRNNVQGFCINVRSCPFLINILQTQGMTASEYLTNTVCYYAGKDPIVCCPQNNSTDSKEIRDSPYGPLEPPVCGFSSLASVVGGVPSAPLVWPWLAALGYENKSNPSQPKWLCGGSLISSRHILTAAHCIRKDLRTVRIGDIDLYSDEDGVIPVQLGIDNVTVHPHYSKYPPVNDVAVIRLNDDVEFSDFVRPICLPVGPSLRNNSFVRTFPFIAGWGSLAPKGATSAVLMQAQVPVVTNAACKDAYSRRNASVIDDRVLCAGYARGGKDACQGDSGGPLMLSQLEHYFQIGVVSYGHECALPGYPGVYTRVTNFLDFIISAMQ
ncbi:transmembrane protease serine 9-like [Megachile rotundata]|uniref:transmembrane protease serine 9-like n=1 Tax=Megachile rotundata TaxID=143995 RepID=UPI003FD112C2